MCGGKSTTTQSTSIPPEVLARYNAVNAYAEGVAQQPFQRYGGEFVAPINQQQMSGINAINQAANMAQPYFNQATNALSSAYGQATPLYGQSLDTMSQAVGQGQNYYNQSLSGINSGIGAAMGYYNNAANTLGAGAANASNYYTQSLGSLAQGLQQGQNYYGQSLGSIGQGALGAQNYYNQSLGSIGQGLQQAQNYYNQSLGSLGQGINQAQNMYGQSLSNLAGGALRANDLYDVSLGNITAGLNTGSQYGADARNYFTQSGQTAQPYMTQANQYVTSGLGAASPLLAQSQQFLEGGTQAVNPDEFGAGQVQKYMSPYLSQVINAQTKLAEQQNAIQRSALNTQAIGAGAFGGDRAGIAQANLAGQQSLAQQATMGNLLQQGYGQALGAFQQQQGVNLAAQQANRAAQQYGQQAAANLAQQQFGQNLAASQQTSNIGQALFNQQLAQGQAMAGLGQQLYAQNIGAANARAGIAQNQFGMAAQQSAMQQAAAQGMFGMQAQQAALQQQAAQGMFGMQAQQAALQQQAAQGTFNMSAQQAAMQQAAAQGMYGMQANQAALQQEAAKGMFGIYQQQSALQQQTGQNAFNMQAQQAALQQEAAKGMFGQQAQQAALQQAAAQGLYGMGSQYASGLAGFGTAAQAAALQGAQAQLGAGTLQQQTQQAQDTAQYQQFLQERGYPFQVAQFLANIAMGTGSLSGSTTTTTAPNSFFSDRRLKKDIKEIGETHDGLPIYSYKYKGGDDLPRIGVMADEAREKHPDAVRRIDGVDTVDYEKIANRASEGGGVVPSRAGEGFADGGHVSPEDLSAILAMQRQFLGPHGQAGLYGQSSQNLPGQKGIVPQASLPVSRLQRHAAPQQQPSGLRQAMSEIGQANQLGEVLMGDKGLGAKMRQAYSTLTGPKKTSDGGVKPSNLSQTQEAGRVPQPAGVKPVEPAQTQETQTTQPASSSVVGSLGSDTITPKDEDIFLPNMTARRGGVVPHKAGGGFLREGVLPYQTEEKYGPEEVNEAESGEKYDLLGDKASGGGGGGKSGSSGLSQAIGLAGSVASAGSTIAKALPFILAPFGLKDGGVVPRQNFAKGGDAKEYTMDDYLNALGQIESSQNYDAVGPQTKTGDRAYGRYQVMGANVPSWTETHYGQRLTPEEFKSNKEAQDAVARGQFGQYLNQYGSPEDAASMWFSGRPMSKAGNAADVTGTTVPAYVQRFRSALGLGAAPSFDGGGGDEGAPTSQMPQRQKQEEASGLIPTNFRTGKPFSSVGDFLTDRQFLVPLLSGVGAMAASPSRYFGGALLQGIGAAAQSYGGMEKTQQEIAESQGRTAEYLASAANKSLFSDPVTGVAMVRLATGQTKPLDEWIDTQEDLAGGAAAAQAARLAYDRKSGQPTAAPSGQPGQAPAGAGAQQPKYQIPVPNGVVFDQSTADRAREDRRMGFGPNAQTVRQTAQDYTKAVNGSANVARQTTPVLNEMALNVSNAIQQSGFNAPGTTFSDRANIVRALNTAANAVGYKGKPFGEADTIDSLSEKFKALQGAAMVAGINQESLGALQAMMSALPNPNMDADAQAQLAAQMLVLNRKDKDRNIHLQRYNQESRNMPYSAGSAFDEKNSQQYLAAVDLVKDLVKYGNQDLKKMLTGQYKPEQIEKIFQESARISGKPYVPGMSRFFTGG